MDQVAQVRGKIDIVDLISTYIPLKKTGANYKAPCPFHNEKSPSFVVSPERQIWHCFGCQKGGDAFTFLMEYERIEFPEALRILAQKAGVTLLQKGFDSQTTSKKEKIYQLNLLASEFYHFLLIRHAVGKKALAYVSERKIKAQTINTYMLGFAPSSGNALSKYLLQKKGYTPQEILDAGLATSRYSGIADFFQGRLIFPLYDHRANIIGFSGRVMPGDTNPSKYINTRETLVYHKGSVFFGLNNSKEAIKKENKAIIMEGEFDTIAAFQEGITNVVAIKGTALTADQINLLARFTQNVALCLDSDNAGHEAMKRSLVLLEKKGITTTVIEMPHGKDPDEAIKTDPIGFKKAVKADRSIYDVLLDWAVKQDDPTTIQGKKTIGDSLLSFYAQISNEIVKDHYLRLLSKTIDVSLEALQKEMDRVQKKEIVKEDVILPKQKRGRDEVLEEYLVALIMQYADPRIAYQQVAGILETYDWVIPSFGKILLHLHSFAALSQFSPSTFVASLPQELITSFDGAFLLPLPTFKTNDTYLAEISKIADELCVLDSKRKIKALNQQILVAEKEENESLLLSLQQKLLILTTALSQKERKKSL